VKKFKSDKTSRLLEMAIDESYARASNTVDQSTNAVLRAKKLLEQAHEKVQGREMPAVKNPVVKNDLQSSRSALERARELVKQSRELIAAGRNRRRG
jgi:hypothetical protein